MRKLAQRTFGSGIAKLLVALGIALLYSILGTGQITRSQSEATPVWTTSRTLTPTRTPTRSSLIASQQSRSLSQPQSIPGQTVVDGNTIALYHFDAPTGAYAIDATGVHTGTLHGNPTVTSSGLYAGVLALNGNEQYVRTGDLGNFTEGTIEAFVDFSTACVYGMNTHFPIITAGGDYDSNSPVLFLGRTTADLSFGMFVNGEWRWAESGINVCRYLLGAPTGLLWPYDVWRFHHVAGTWGPRGMEIWVDGVLHGVGNNNLGAPEPYPYKCNPQDYTGQPEPGATTGTPNLLYPVSCRTPRPYPTMTSLPYWDYAGPLPLYSTFLIGCDSRIADPGYGNWSPCYSGRIDEVRISNAQRTFSYILVPTTTPTPTNTPVPISGEYQKDSYTKALFHLDFKCASFNVPEEVTTQCPSIGSSATIAAGGRFGSALTAAGSNSESSINIGTLSGQLTGLGAGTLEAWVEFSDSTIDQTIYQTRKNWNGGPILTFKGVANGPIRLEMSDGNGNNPSLVSDVTLASLVGCWHHIAATFGARGMEIWIDGSLHGVNYQYTGGTAVVQSDGGWRAVCDYFNGKCVKGKVDELRISNIQRVFSPNAPAFRPIPKMPQAAGTAAFLPFIQMNQGAPISPCAFGS